MDDETKLSGAPAAAAAPEDVPDWKRADRPKDGPMWRKNVDDIPPAARNLIEKYSGIPTDEVVPHVLRMVITFFILSSSRPRIEHTRAYSSWSGLVSKHLSHVPSA